MTTEELLNILEGQDEITEILNNKCDTERDQTIEGLKSVNELNTFERDEVILESINYFDVDTVKDQIKYIECVNKPEIEIIKKRQELEVLENGKDLEQETLAEYDRIFISKGDEILVKFAERKKEVIEVLESDDELEENGAKNKEDPAKVPESSDKFELGTTVKIIETNVLDTGNDLKVKTVNAIEIIVSDDELEKVTLEESNTITKVSNVEILESGDETDGIVEEKEKEPEGLVTDKNSGQSNVEILDTKPDIVELLESGDELEAESVEEKAKNSKNVETVDNTKAIIFQENRDKGTDIIKSGVKSKEDILTSSDKVLDLAGKYVVETIKETNEVVEITTAADKSQLHILEKYNKSNGVLEFGKKLEIKTCEEKEVIVLLDEETFGEKDKSVGVLDLGDKIREEVLEDKDEISKNLIPDDKSGHSNVEILEPRNDLVEVIESDDELEGNTVGQTANKTLESSDNLEKETNAVSQIIVSDNLEERDEAIKVLDSGDELEKTENETANETLESSDNLTVETNAVSRIFAGDNLKERDEAITVLDSGDEETENEICKTNIDLEISDSLIEIEEERDIAIEVFDSDDDL